MTARHDPGPTRATNDIQGRAPGRIIVALQRGPVPDHHTLVGQAHRGHDRGRGAATAAATRGDVPTAARTAGQVAGHAAGHAAGLGPDLDPVNGREVRRFKARAGPGVARTRRLVIVTTESAHTGHVARAAHGPVGVTQRMRKTGERCIRRKDRKSSR